MIVFKKVKADDYNTEAELVMKVEEFYWPEVAENFVHFLQGCGYIVQGIDVAEYLMEQYAFQKREKPDVLINGQEVSLPTKKGKRHAKKK